MYSPYVTPLTNKVVVRPMIKATVADFVDFPFSANCFREMILNTIAGNRIKIHRISLNKKTVSGTKPRRFGRNIKDAKYTKMQMQLKMMLTDTLFIYHHEQYLTPAITGEKARSGFESSSEAAMVDGDVIHLAIIIPICFFFRWFIRFKFDPFL